MAFPVPLPERCRDGLGGDGPMPSNRAGPSRGAAASAGAISGSRAGLSRARGSRRASIDLPKSSTTWYRKSHDFVTKCSGKHHGKCEVCRTMCG